MAFEGEKAAGGRVESWVESMDAHPRKGRRSRSRFAVAMTLSSAGWTGLGVPCMGRTREQGGQGREQERAEGRESGAKLSRREGGKWGSGGTAGTAR